MAARNRVEEPAWPEFYKSTANWSPAATLTKALSLFEADGPSRKGCFAIDLGCGAGRDTFELLRRGWRVLAIDNQPEAIRFIRSAVPHKFRTRLQARLTSFETLKLPKCDLINGSSSLPFCHPKRFNVFWSEIIASLRPGGRFAGHFFGVHDGWAGSTDMTFHTASQVRRMLTPLKAEFFNEEEYDGTTASGRKKHWHVFSVVAKML
jgi:SAM-dependent methyltransferase